MAVALLVQTIPVLRRISSVLNTAREINNKCGPICDLVDALLKGLELLEQSTITNMIKQATLMALKDYLEKTETEVKERGSNADALAQFFEDNGTVTMLDQLIQDLSKSMLDLGTKILRHIMDPYYYKALIVLFQGEQLEQRSTDDARNKNKTDLLQYRWSELYDSFTSSAEIGKGRQSVINKGQLHSIPVAIKKFDEKKPGIMKRFNKEIRIISKLQHKNIVEFLGYCDEYEEKVVEEGEEFRVENIRHLSIVSRYMTNESMIGVTEAGTISLKRNSKRVDWPTLFKIIQGIAYGLRYLHSEGVVHLDLKPKTILLDADTTPKINDFGTARELLPGGDQITFNTLSKPGTEGYMAPELSSSEKPRVSAKKCDVYSFGVILLEAMNHVCVQKASRPRDHKGWTDRIQKADEWRNLFDKKLVSDQHLPMATSCVLAGVRCTLDDPESRPSMQDVVAILAAGSRSSQKEVNNKKKPAPTIASRSSAPLPVPDGGSQRRTTKPDILTKGKLKEQQLADMKEVAAYLGPHGITPGVAELLLWRCQWSCQGVRNKCDSDANKLLAGIHLKLEDLAETIKPNFADATCIRCGRSFEAGVMASAWCKHYCCNGCWGTHLRDEVTKKGSRCVPLRCPSRGCEVPVVRELVEQRVEDRKLRDTYFGHLLLESYVNDSDDGRRVWCPDK